MLLLDVLMLPPVQDDVPAPHIGDRKDALFASDGQLFVWLIDHGERF